MKMEMVSALVETHFPMIPMNPRTQMRMVLAIIAIIV